MADYEAQSHSKRRKQSKHMAKPIEKGTERAESYWKSQALHGGAAQRDISYLLALKRLLQTTPGPPGELRTAHVCLTLDSIHRLWLRVI